eukprot:6194104-Pleurochrysis_carterae.AAC.2
MPLDGVRVMSVLAHEAEQLDVEQLVVLGHAGQRRLGRHDGPHLLNHVCLLLGRNHRPGGAVALVRRGGARRAAALVRVAPSDMRRSSRRTDAERGHCQCKSDCCPHELRRIVCAQVVQ